MQNILHTLEVQDIALAQEAHGILAPVSSNSSFRTETETVDEEEIEVKLLGKAVGIEFYCSTIIFMMKIFMPKLTSVGSVINDDTKIVKL